LLLKYQLPGNLRKFEYRGIEKNKLNPMKYECVIAMIIITNMIFAFKIYFYFPMKAIKILHYMENHE